MVDMRRKQCVSQIIKTMQILKEKELSYDKEKLIYEIMGEYVVSRRTALEYLQTAVCMFKKIEAPDKKELLAEADIILKEKII